MKNKELTPQEMIERIEMAPIEMQTKVAKAFISDKINNDDVQYLYNTDSIEEMNEKDVIIENINAQPIDGIGANGFIIRNTQPGIGNKNYITTSLGGWNTCVKGYPQDKNCNVLSNCVGYASGRFNEIINEARDINGCAYKTLNCNAWRFPERAIAAGLKIGSEPRLGAIMCWKRNGAAGHVAIVEEVRNAESVLTSESNYGGAAFFNANRQNTNGRWGLNSNYEFECFIYLPDDVQTIIENNEEIIIPEPVQTPNISKPIEDELQVGDNVKIIGTGNGSCYGTSNTAYGIGWTRQILRIWNGKKYPYQVGNKTGTTGFYQSSSLQKK